MLEDPGETYKRTTVNTQFVIVVFFFPLKDIGKYLNLWCIWRGFQVHKESPKTGVYHCEGGDYL